jgi:hypothetical protein
MAVPEYVIAQSIADSINAATFTGTITSITATVDEDPDYENLDDPGSTAAKLYVVPGTNIEIEAGSTRGADLHTYDVVLLLVKRLGPDTDRETLAELRTQITDRLLRDRFVAGSLRANVPADYDYTGGGVIPFHREALRGPKVFGAQILAQFASLRTRH